MKRNLWIVIICILAAAVISVILLQKPQQTVAPEIAIAEQYGLAYAPLQVMRELKLLEEELPGVAISWKQLGNTAAIREAMLAKEVDAGFMAIPPFLIGFDKGMDWKITTGLSESPVALVTNRPHIKSVADFGERDRIALPQPGSIQHILLAMACERQLGDAKRLDNLLVTLAHPDGMNALLTGKEITAHFTTPPYLNKELQQPNIRRILDGEEALGGGFTFVVGVTTGEFYRQQPHTYRAFVKALEKAVQYVKKEPEKTARMLAGQYKIPETELLKYLTEPGSDYTTEVKGVARFANFMFKTGYLSQKPDLNELFWENVKHD